MAKRRKNTKVGDVFVARTSDTCKRYFQYITSDLTQLNSDVIRVFKKIYPVDSEPSLVEIVSDEVDFYIHTTTIAGIELGFWDLCGNILDVGEIGHILFRSSKDSGDLSVTISERWVIWNVNGERKYVGKLEGECQKAEIGLVYAPQNVISILQGTYVSHYPKFK